MHLVATVLSLGGWSPILIMHLIGWRRRGVTVHVVNGVVVRTEVT
jgi:hypothetical protein